MPKYEYGIVGPFVSLIRQHTTKQAMVDNLKQDLQKLLYSMRSITKEMIDHKLDWYSNEFDYKLTDKCYTTNDKGHIKINLEKHNFDYYVALFRMLTVPMVNADDPHMFQIFI